MDGLEFFRDEVRDVLRIVADSVKFTARAARVVDGATVGSKLHDDKIAGLDECERARPEVAVERPAGSATEGPIDDIDLARVEERRELIAPTPLSAAAVAATVAHGGIADEKQRRQISVRGKIFASRGNLRFIFRLAVYELGGKILRSSGHDGHDPNAHVM